MSGIRLCADARLVCADTRCVYDLLRMALPDDASHRCGCHCNAHRKARIMNTRTRFAATLVSIVTTCVIAAGAASAQPPTSPLSCRRLLRTRSRLTCRRSPSPGPSSSSRAGPMPHTWSGCSPSEPLPRLGPGRRDSTWELGRARPDSIQVSQRPGPRQRSRRRSSPAMVRRSHCWRSPHSPDSRSARAAPPHRAASALLPHAPPDPSPRVRPRGVGEVTRQQACTPVVAGASPT